MFNKKIIDYTNIFISFYIFQSLAFFYLFFLNSNKNLLLSRLIDLKIVSNTNSILTFLNSLIIFSLAGFPPLSGFFIKFFLFFSLLNNNILWFSIIFVLISCVSAYYYLQINIFICKLKNEKKIYKLVYRLNLLSNYTLIIAIFAITFYVFFINYI